MNLRVEIIRMVCAHWGCAESSMVESAGQPSEVLKIAPAKKAFVCAVEILMHPCLGKQQLTMAQVAFYFNVPHRWIERAMNQHFYFMSHADYSVILNRLLERVNEKLQTHKQWHTTSHEGTALQS